MWRAAGPAGSEEYSAADDDYDAPIVQKRFPHSPRGAAWHAAEGSDDDGEEGVEASPAYVPPPSLSRSRHGQRFRGAYPGHGAAREEPYVPRGAPNASAGVRGTDPDGTQHRSSSTSDRDMFDSRLLGPASMPAQPPLAAAARPGLGGVRDWEDDADADSSGGQPRKAPDAQLARRPSGVPRVPQRFAGAPPSTSGSGIDAELASSAFLDARVGVPKRAADPVPAADAAHHPAKKHRVTEGLGESGDLAAAAAVSGEAGEASGVRYKPFSIVWAKLGSYPFWPAQIQEPRTPAQKRLKHRRDDYFVVFMGDNNFAWVPPSAVQEFTRDYGKRVKGKYPGLQQAVDDAWAAIGRARPPDP